MMKLFLFTWISIGWLVNLYYTTKHANKYSKMLAEGKLTYDRFIVGWFMTLLLWPVTIFNQERKR